jgi:predicted Rossmann-fold nucleotide-binding protein
MLWLGAGGLVAFPGGVGTASMIALARKEGMQVLEVKE